MLTITTLAATLGSISGSSAKANEFVRSTDSIRPVTAEWINNTNQTQTLYWVDFVGQRRHYKSMGPGERFQQGSFESHVWMAVDATGMTQRWTLDSRPRQSFELRAALGRPTTVSFTNNSDREVYVVMRSPGGELKYEKLAPQTTRGLDIHVGWRATKIQAGRYVSIDLPAIRSGMQFKVSEWFGQVRLSWNYRQPSPPVPPAPPAPTRPQTLQGALGIQVSDLGGGRLLVTSVGGGLGARILSTGDLIASRAMVGIPVRAGEPAQAGAILTQLELLPANGGPLRTINVRSELGVVIIGG